MRKLDDVLFGSIELFCLAAEYNSFSVAANFAGVTPAAVSRSIARLESRLNVQLFARNTRSVRLTSAGLIFAERCKHALAVMNDAGRLISSENISDSGVVRISMPTTYAHYRILPKVGAFKLVYPNVDLQLHISNSNINFFDGDFDLAIRARENKDSNLVARKIEDAELVVVASKDYIKKKGQPNSIEELEQHECIQFILPSSGKAIPWLFKQDGSAVDLMTQGSVSCIDEVLGGLSLAKGGAGIYQIYRFVVQSELKSGELVELLAPFGGRTRPFSILYPYNKYIANSTRLFMDFMANEIRRDSEIGV